VREVEDPVTAGYALVYELAAGKPFGGYCCVFPEASRDAGQVFRIAAQVGLVEQFQARLERALRERRRVRDEEWHALLAQVSWPRPLPEWDRAAIGEMKLLFNPAATPDWPEPEGVRGCWFGFQHPEMARDVRPISRKLADAFVSWVRRRAS
jgi:hypothetical protein